MAENGHTPCKLFLVLKSPATLNLSGVTSISRGGRLEHAIKLVKHGECTDNVGVYGSIAEIAGFLANNASALEAVTWSEGTVFGNCENFINSGRTIFMTTNDKPPFQYVNKSLSKVGLSELSVHKNADFGKWLKVATSMFAVLQKHKDIIVEELAADSSSKAIKFQRKLFFENQKKLTKMLHAGIKTTKLTKLIDPVTKEWVDNFDTVKKRVVDFWSSEANSAHTAQEWCWSDLCTPDSIKTHTAEEVIDSISWTELIYCLLSKSDKSAPGIDRVSYLLLKRCPEKLLSE